MKFIIFFGLFVLIGLVTAPADCLAGALSGLELCYTIIIPSLFPFFVCSKLLIGSGAAKKLGDMCHNIMRPLFNLPGSAGIALVLGLLSGYPVGAQCAADLYEKNLCTKAEAQRMIGFCNNSGPLFIMGSVGAGMMHSAQAGIVMYAIHVLSALTLGFMLRFYKADEKMTLQCAKYRQTAPEFHSFGAALSDAVSKSAELILYVCGFIVFFNALVAILFRFNIIFAMQNFLKLLGISTEVSNALAFGIFEITGGAVRAVALPTAQLKIIVVSALLAWSGISVILQVAGIISKVGLSPYILIFSKAFQALIASIYALIFLRFAPSALQVFASNKSATV
ncbi:MAG: hypothetical protein M0R40_10805, partial [Firmicutes bacterium]|nr:hypothetical protein [Bacillota bacterium]